jgi:nucleoside-diphosphate-sugar epimerase
MRVLVSGGAGFIGSHLVDKLIEQGHYVYALDNFSTGKMSNLSEVKGSKNLEIIRSDIRRISASLIAKLKRVEGICHLAAMADVRASIDNPILTSDVNVMGTLRVLETAKTLKVKRVVFASSAAVYGLAEEFPIDEEMKMAPISPYGASKAACELYCRAFEESTGVETVSLRYFNVYGPRQTAGQYSGVIAKFAGNLLRGEALEIFGDGSQSRDFVYVDDVVDATIRALQRKLESRAFNIASGVEITISDLSEIMQTLVEKHSSVRFLSPRPGDPHRGLADIKRARIELEYNPRTSFKDGLAKTIEWYSGWPRKDAS